jgi:hypothetical protein
MNIEPNQRTMAALFQALGAVVRSVVATLPPAQQRVFLVRLMDAADSAEAAKDDTLLALLNALTEIGQSEQRPGSDGAG